MRALRSMLAAGALAAAGIGAAAAPPAGTLAAPADLRAEARRAGEGGEPLVLLFSLPDCRYCAVVRRNYLVPLARSGALAVRELGLTDSAPVKGFSGEPASGRALAAAYGVRVAPTVLMLGPDGRLLAPPLVGGDVAGMYGAYLDGALEQARAALAPAGAATRAH